MKAKRWLWRLRGVISGEPDLERQIGDLIAAGHLTIGRHTYQPQFRVIRHGRDDPPVRIGAFCSIAHEVEFMTGGAHRMDRVTTFPLHSRWRLSNAPDADDRPTKESTIVGNDVWIGRGARILPGVKIGDGAVVAAHAVVVRHVEPYTIVGGNPAVLIRERCTREQASALGLVAWWDWPDDLIRQRADDIAGATVDDFLERYANR